VEPKLTAYLPEIARDRTALRLKPEAGVSLLLGADAEISDVSVHVSQIEGGLSVKA